MKRSKLATPVAAIIAGIALSIATPGLATAANDKSTAAIVANDKSKSDRPLPPKCNPKYMTTPGECPILY